MVCKICLPLLVALLRLLLLCLFSSITICGIRSYYEQASKELSPNINCALAASIVMHNGLTITDAGVYIGWEYLGDHITTFIISGQFI